MITWFKRLLIALGIVAGSIGLLLLFFYFYFSGDYSVPKTVAQDPTIPHVTIDGITFHAETYGSDTNQVVVVLHGGPGNDFRYLLDLKVLADDYFVVFYDQRGTGLSPRVPAEELSLQTSIEDLHRIVTHYGHGKKVNIIGHSWGAMLASAYLGRHPDLVHKIVLAEPGFLTNETQAVLEENFAVELSFDLIKVAIRSWFQSLHVDGPDDQAQMDYFWLALASTDIPENPTAIYYCDRSLSNGSLAAWRFGSMAASTIPTTGMDAEGRIGSQLIEGVDRYNGHVLFLAGSCNGLIGPEFQKQHLPLFPNATMVVIEGAGHTMIGEKPKEVLPVIRKYFSEVEELGVAAQ